MLRIDRSRLLTYLLVILPLMTLLVGMTAGCSSDPSCDCDFETDRPYCENCAS